jgi:hypothetical protein
MPILTGKLLDDVEGANLLRSVLDSGRRVRRRKIADVIGLREKSAAMPASPKVEVVEEPVTLHPAALVAAVE